ncbi:MAG: cysteine--tRNA ligase, partial [Tranquillimonas sp.]
STHYRKPMDWTAKKADEAEKTLSDWQMSLHQAGYGSAMVASLKERGLWQPLPEVVDALADDLNTHMALTALRKAHMPGTASRMVQFAASLDFLGLVADWDALGASAGLGAASADEHPDRDLIARLLAKRQELKRQKEFAEADELRAVLLSAGVKVEDQPGGTSAFEITDGFDPSQLDAYR